MNKNQWVNGPEISNEVVGGSEGLRRLRELIEDGHPIESRRHPQAERDIWQYRLAVQGDVSPLRRDETGFTYVPKEPVMLPEPVVAKVEETTYKFVRLPAKIDFGAVAVCPRCHAKTQRYSYKALEGKRHKDPVKEKIPCINCNGWGIVPNKGPIPLTMP